MQTVVPYNIDISSSKFSKQTIPPSLDDQSVNQSVDCQPIHQSISLLENQKRIQGPMIKHGISQAYKTGTRPGSPALLALLSSDKGLTSNASHRSSTSSSPSASSKCPTASGKGRQDNVETASRVVWVRVGSTLVVPEGVQKKLWGTGTHSASLRRLHSKATPWTDRPSCEVCRLLPIFPHPGEGGGLSCLSTRPFPCLPGDCRPHPQRQRPSPR